MSYKKIIIILAVALGLTFIVGHAPSAAALFDNASDQACQGVGLGTAGCDNTATKKVSGLINTVINLLSAVVAIGAVIMIIVGGFKYITSGGDSSKTSSAKNTIIYAIVGLIIVALAQFFVKFVLQNVNK